jgi:hypothetical protein
VCARARRKPSKPRNCPGSPESPATAQKAWQGSFAARFLTGDVFSAVGARRVAVNVVADARQPSLGPSRNHSGSPAPQLRNVEVPRVRLPGGVREHLAPPVQCDWLCVRLHHLSLWGQRCTGMQWAHLVHCENAKELHKAPIHVWTHCHYPDRTHCPDSPVSRAWLAAAVGRTETEIAAQNLTAHSHQSAALRKQSSKSK